MSAPHDCEIQINVHNMIAFFHHMIETYNLQEVEVSRNISDETITINYNQKMHYILIDNIKHAAMAWNAAINR